VQREELPPLIRALLDPAAYPEPPPSVELRQTHISYLLLAGDRAYKIKKPLDLGFLNFSTPARRAYYCRREVALNRRLAPDVYLGVVPIVERRGQIRLGGRGRLRERAIAMRRLPEEGMLPRLLARGEATPALMARIADRLAAFHRTAASGPRVARYGSPASVRRNVENNLVRAEPYVGRTVSAAQYAHLRRWTDAFLREQRALLRQRVRAARVRDGHGDVHAGSICVVGDEVVLFDCIEFSNALRCTDVAAEIAFLAMDLDHYGRADLAEAFVAAYVAASGDTELRALLPFYQSYRAEVRGLVTSIAADNATIAADERARLEAAAQGYFDLAYYAYAGGAPRPLLLLLGGLPGTGKSTLAAALAPRLAMVAVNSDVVRKRRAGLKPTTRRAAGPGEGLYTAAANEATYAALLAEAEDWLQRGVSVALDASFRRAADRAGVAALAARLGVPWLAVECVSAPETARARLAARAHDAGAVSDADWAIREQLTAEWEPWDELPAARRLRLDTGGALEAAVAAVLAAAGGLG
jgi:aminoglycoside phosphotransferase family enzyme/predicted kinase